MIERMGSKIASTVRTPGSIEAERNQSLTPQQLDDSPTDQPSSRSRASSKIGEMNQQAAQRKYAITRPLTEPQAPGTPISPDEALRRIGALPVPKLSDAPRNLPPEERQAIYQDNLKKYNQQRAEIADAALNNPRPPKREDYKNLNGASVDHEYREALSNHKRQITELERISAEAKAQPTKPPAPPVDPANELIDFDKINRERRNELKGEAAILIFKHSREAEGRPVLEYHDLENILNELADRRDLTDLEKAYVWSQIADAKGPTSFPSGEFKKGAYEISLDGSRKEIRDSHPLREGNTPNHSVVSFTDGYHGFGEGTGMANLPKEETDRIIEKTERGKGVGNHRLSDDVPGIGKNPGDAEASRRTVAAFHAYREAEEGERFRAFADKWIEGMVEP